MLKKALAKVLVRLSEQPFTICSRFGWPAVAALLFYVTLRKFDKGTVREEGGKRYRILMLDRVVFTQDVLASLGSGSEFEVVKPLNNSIKGLAHGILPAYLDDNFYLTDEAQAIACKRRYREFLKAMWCGLERYVKFDAVVTGNFGYYAERELALVLEEMGTPFIAMHKENLKSPGRMEFSKIIYRDRRGPFGGRKIVVYNEGERALQIETRVASPEKITVCGMPRLDRVHEWRRNNAGKQRSAHRRPRVLLFSFTPKAVLPRIGRRPQAGFVGNAERIEESLELLNWEELSRQTHQAVLTLAKENPEIGVVIKSKARVREQSEMRRMIGEETKLPDNLEIVAGGDPLDLIKKSDVVCGFNTTGLLEALATGKPVIVPRFAEAMERNMQPYIVDLEDAVEYAKSPAELVALLRRHALSRRPIPLELSFAQQRVLVRWVGNPDGRAGERVRSTVLSEIRSSVDAHMSRAYG
jgi:hypothetical protein